MARVEFEGSVHRLGRMPLHVWEHVAVNLQRDRNVRMAEQLGYYLGVYPLPEQERGSRVSQIVEAYRWQCGATQ